MLFERFVEESRAWWSAYLQAVSRAQRAGNIVTNGAKVLYPNILLVTRCSGYYVAELIGATEKFHGLSVKRHEEKSIYRYLSQFDDTEPDPLCHLDSSVVGFRFLCLAHGADFDAIKNRFPHIELYELKLNRVGGHGSIFAFGKNFVSCIIENSVLVNRKENVFRCKSILSAWIVKSGIDKTELLELFESTTQGNEVKGVHHSVGEHEHRLVVSGQLQSMVLFPNLRETTIGEFIRLHPEVVRAAFKTEHFEYEPYLDWLEHDGTCIDTAINPDLLVKRSDGYYDIYDLKTAVLDKKSLTKASRSRRRFIDYVEEGISQLANYREYFEFTRNAEHAKNKYGIEVKDPLLVLVVGSWENVDVDEVNQACRKYHNVQVIDYDTVCQMFIGAG